VTDLRKENTRLKQLVAEVVLENRLLKKSMTAVDSDSIRVVQTPYQAPNANAYVTGSPHGARQLRWA